MSADSPRTNAACEQVHEDYGVLDGRHKPLVALCRTLEGEVAHLTEENALLRRTVVMLTRHGTDDTQEATP